MKASTSAKIKVLNSLTRQKDLLEISKNELTWYGCGPTVYDSPHIGHARTYVSFDIIRRILTDYFKIKVTYCMNITDIDDKIIRRARQEYLMNQYKEENHTRAELVKDAISANNILKAKILEETDLLKKEIFQGHYSQNDQYIQKFAQGGDEEYPSSLFIQDCWGVISEYLDLEHGHTVNKNELFFALPKKFEDEFLQTMDTLGVLRPDIMTRVTEFVPQIVDYIKKIISNKYAYAAPSGSVYFDVPSFSKQHSYAKLVPESAGDIKSLAEGEGSLNAGDGEKRSPRDFALWKASKAGEPSWDSPWGKGRPGWHIECSVMATCAFGSQMDIHTGGHDLKFPHHDNEIAQAEAYSDGGCWVRYFMHSGHLTINGCKMSKSLKNFITIQSALSGSSPRRLRILFLLHLWNQPFDYSADSLNEAVVYEKQLIEFILTAKSYCRHMLGSVDQVDPLLEDHKKMLHESLCDSFNTRQALNEIKTLISTTNSFMSTNMSTRNSSRVAEIADFVICTFNLFGVFKFYSLNSFTIYSKQLSLKTVGTDLQPFVSIIETGLTTFLKTTAQIQQLLDSFNLSNGEDFLSKMADCANNLGKYTQGQIKGLPKLLLSTDQTDDFVSLQFSDISALERKAEEHENFESMAYPYVEFVSKLRDYHRYTSISMITSIKKMRKSHHTIGQGKLDELDAAVKVIMEHCDVLRKKLWDLDIKLEDISGGEPAIIKFCDSELKSN